MCCQSKLMLYIFLHDIYVYNIKILYHGIPNIYVYICTCTHTYENTTKFYKIIKNEGKAEVNHKID